MKDYPINISFADITNKKYSFSSIETLYNFLKKERDFWISKQNTPTSTETRSRYINSNNILSPAIHAIDSWRNTFNDWSSEALRANVNGIIDQYKNRFFQEWLCSESILSMQAIECQEKFGGEAADAFIDFTLRKTLLSPNDYNHFLGIMYAYEIENQNSEILKRRNSEKKSFMSLRNDLEESKKLLINNVDEFQTDIRIWKEAEKQQWNQWSQSTGENWSEWVKNAHQVYNSDKIEKRDQFINFMGGCKTRISELENTYQEKLRLEKPAIYWQKAAKRYGIQGGLWSLTVLALGLLGIVYFREFFNDWLQGKEIGIQLNTLQGIALYGSILAVYAFLMRIFSRLAFSSFHLMRDAEEREQLTYLYLSLSKEHTVDESSRSIILQSLFSRSETGLLSSESGPTMPGLHEILKTGTKS